MDNLLEMLNQQNFIVHVFAGISMLIYIVLFILSAIGVSQIATNRQIKSSWLAFVPVFQYMMIGKIADDIISSKNKISKNKNRKFKYSIIYPLLSVLNPFNLVNSGLSIATYLYLPEKFSLWYLSIGTGTLPHIVSIIFGFIEIALLILFVSIMKEIYDEYDRKNTNVYVMMSVLFKLQPFILFFLKDKAPFEYEYTIYEDEYNDEHYEYFNELRK